MSCPGTPKIEYMLTRPASAAGNVMENAFDGEMHISTTGQDPSVALLIRHMVNLEVGTTLMAGFRRTMRCRNTGRYPISR
jgi:hypothetical protein